MPLSGDWVYLDPKFVERVWLPPAFQESRSECNIHVSIGKRAKIFGLLPEVKDPIEPHPAFAVVT